MCYWKDVYMRQEQLHDWREYAALRRLAREAGQAESRSSRPYASYLASLGRLMVVWGRRLETQYHA